MRCCSACGYATQGNRNARKPVVAQGEHEVTVQGVYLPADPQERVDALAVVGDELKVGAMVGGDWNCVPDVTLDVHHLEGQGGRGSLLWWGVSTRSQKNKRTPLY